MVVVAEEIESHLGLKCGVDGWINNKAESCEDYLRIEWSFFYSLSFVILLSENKMKGKSNT